MKGKKGVELALNTIILIVLAIIVLVALVLLFNRSSGSFGEKMDSFFTSSNVDSVVSQCDTLGEQERKYEFCCVNRTVKLSKSEKLELTCSLASEKSWGSSINKLVCTGAC
ncbi:hypothetical protein FJZ17_00145 [Candidatus Pacearchaeota archaeon]|nr:hypothetical protein [Candidatus Pacearchaeota archaeon]